MIDYLVEYSQNSYYVQSHLFQKDSLFQIMSKVIEKNKNFKMFKKIMFSVSLFQCSNSDNFVKELADELKNNTITYISTYETSISENGIIAIAEALKINTSLQVL